MWLSHSKRNKLIKREKNVDFEYGVIISLFVLNRYVLIIAASKYMSIRKNWIIITFIWHSLSISSIQFHSKIIMCNGKWKMFLQYSFQSHQHSNDSEKYSVSYEIWPEVLCVSTQQVAEFTREYPFDGLRLDSTRNLMQWLCCTA